MGHEVQKEVVHVSRKIRLLKNVEISWGNLIFVQEKQAIYLSGVRKLSGFSI